MADESEGRAGEGGSGGGESEAAGPGEGESRSSPYRGTGSDFDDEVYPRSYRTPGGINLKMAMREYVEGHDRGWDHETKSRKAAESLEEEESEKGYLGPGQAVESGASTGRIAGSEETLPEGVEVREREGRPRFGVSVPEKLAFHRGPDTWRDRVEELVHGTVEEPPDDGGG